MQIFGYVLFLKSFNRKFRYLFIAEGLGNEDACQFLPGAILYLLDLLRYY